jgi:fructokinase
MITVAGEALIDVIVDQSGTVTAHPGGGPFNVARAVAALGGRCQFLCRLGADAFGRRLRAALEERQVSLPVAQPTDAPTTLAIAELDEFGVADYRFYLHGTSAPQLRLQDTPPGVLIGSTAVAVGGLGLVVEPMASTLRTLLQTAEPEATVLLDANCRPRAIEDLESYRDSFEGFLRRTDIVKVSTEDLRMLAPGADVRTGARALLDFNPSAVIVTDGPAPVAVHTAAGERSVPVRAVTIVDTVGAGDAFVAGLLTWWTNHGRRRADSADLDVLTEATRAAAQVAAVACTVAGADLPRAFVWADADRVRDLADQPG